ncbi:MAG: T9SS type A sorting domain-containing protein [Bacteroidota bacterium]|jgi:hypothetical protein
MKNVILLALISIVQPTNAQWSYSGLGGIRVTDLIVYSDTLYASTYDGIYKKYIFNTDTSWTRCGMQRNHVVQTLVPNDRTFICAIEVGSTRMTRIYKSTDGGISFALIDTSVGHFMVYNFLHKIAHPDGNYDTLYFVSHQRKTFDGGASWDSMNDVSWGHFIEVDPANHSRIIVGGEGAWQSANLETSSDYGNTWRFANMNGYFEGDNSLHALAMNGNDWFGAGEGVICKTSDAGNNWSQLLNTWSYPLQWGLYIFDIEFSPSNTNRLYATGDGYSAYRVPLFYSGDYGITWDTLSYATNNMPHIVSLAVKSTANGDRVFVGGQGVFMYENIFTGVHDDYRTRSDRYSLSSSYPNPFNPSTKIKYQIPVASFVMLKVYDLLGREVATLVNELQQAGSKSVEFRAENLPSGVYYYRLEAGSFTETKKLLLLR